jgi:DNA-binding NarL/FixJ family response regulator
MDKINILIADDHKLTREAWSFVLNSDPRFHVISECGNADEAVNEAKAKNPHVVLMDINMEPFSGFVATERIRVESPSSKIIGISMDTNPEYAIKMFKMGAVGYLTKNSSSEEMINAVLGVNRGTKYICQEIKDNISDQFLNAKGPNPNLNSLTRRKYKLLLPLPMGFHPEE